MEKSLDWDKKLAYLCTRFRAGNGPWARGEGRGGERGSLTRMRRGKTSSDGRPACFFCGTPGSPGEDNENNKRDTYNAEFDPGSG